MEQSSQSILDQALKLPVNERAEVAEQLIQSLDPQANSEVESAWQQEIQQRLSEIDSGVARTIPWEEVQRRLTHGN
jgi:putative addiction module component (TIGR02574 family)